MLIYHKMKFKLLFSFLIGSAMTMAAEGYMDGVEYFRADQPEEAAIILNNTIGQPSTDKATAYYYLGQIALRNGNKAKAKELFDKGVQANADNGYNYVGLGALALANNDPKAAEDYFKQAKKLAKKDADLLTEIPRAYFEANPTTYANQIDKDLKELKKKFKDAPAPYILEGDLLAGTDVGQSAGMYDMAATFDHSAKQNPDAHPEAYVKYARVIFKVNPRGAIAMLKKLLTYQPNSALVQRELAEKLYDNNQLTLAAKQYEDYIKNPNSFQKDKQRLAGLLYFAQRYPESFDLATEILTKDPGNFYMERMQFYNKKAMGDTIAAVQAAETLLNNPKAQLNAQDFTQYGDLLTDMGKSDEALAMYEKAVAVDPTKIALLKDLSSAYNHALKFDKAVETMQKYVDAAGDEADANDLLTLALRYNALAQAQQKEENPEWKANSDKAVAIINDVVERTPGHPLVLNYRSRILQVANNNEMTEDVAKADLDLLAALDSDPENLENRKGIYTQVLGRLGNYYVTHGNVAEALKMFERFYQINPSPELQKYIETLKTTASGEAQ